MVMYEIDLIDSSPKKRKISSNPHGYAHEDRISNLPEPIIHHILSFLQTIEVIKTSILSRRWRYLWTSIPYLDFNFEALVDTQLDSWRDMSFTEAFKDFVNWVLVFQNGSTNIIRFKLWSCNFIKEWTVKRWIHVAVKRNVQELDLSICPSMMLKMSVELPQWLVECESLQVLKLNLFQCVLKLPRVTGFTRLKSLELLFVELLDESLTRIFFSSLPLLENLSLKECLLSKLKVLDISTSSLKKLFIENIGSTTGSDSGGLCKSKLMLSCPNLISFDYIGPVTQDYCLHNLSSLDSAFIHLIDEKDKVEDVGFLMCKILRGLYNATALKLSMVFLEEIYTVLGEPRFFATPFNNLKSLKLCAGIDGCYMEVLILLLKCCPNLGALVILFMETNECSDYWKLEDEAIKCLAYNLKRVELIEVRGQENELELVRFLLKNGLVLEKLIITWYSYLKNLLEIKGEILGFPQSSSGVTITFRKPQPEVDFHFL